MLCCQCDYYSSACLFIITCPANSCSVCHKMVIHFSILSCQGHIRGLPYGWNMLKCTRKIVLVRRMPVVIMAWRTVAGMTVSGMQMLDSANCAQPKSKQRSDWLLPKVGMKMWKHSHPVFVTIASACCRLWEKAMVLGRSCLVVMVNVQVIRLPESCVKPVDSKES